MRARRLRVQHWLRHEPLGQSVYLHLIFLCLVVLICLLSSPVRLSTIAINPHPSAISVTAVALAPTSSSVVKKSKPVKKMQKKRHLSKPKAAISLAEKKKKHKTSVKKKPAKKIHKIAKVKKKLTKTVKPKKTTVKPKTTTHKSTWQSAQSAWQKAEQSGALDRVKQAYMAQIQQLIRANWTNSFAPNLSLIATLQISVSRVGIITDVKVLKSSDNSAFDRQAVLAVERSSPLPLPDSVELRQEFSTIVLPFSNLGENNATSA